VPLVLLLIALAALPVVNVAGPQDRTRYELTRRLVLRHTLTVEPGLFDRAVFGGKTYSDKAPGMSFAAVPSYELERAAGIARAPSGWRPEGDLSLWLVRVLTSGVLFLVAVVVVGRLAEELRPGTGAATAAIFGVATLAAPLAPTFFEHDAAAAFGIAAFALLRSRRLVLAGLAAGIAVLFQYAAVLIAVALLVLAALRRRRAALWFVLGAVPPAVALAAYDWAAFGSPFHLSYRYVAYPFAERQHHGFFGIGVPTPGGLREVLAGSRGLLVFSPVLLAAAFGLVRWWWRERCADAVVAGVVSVAFVLLAAGYFLPYGGNSPGPRFLAPALPFLALGLPFAIQRSPRTTLVLALVAGGLTTADGVTWGIRRYDDTSWVPSRGDIAKTVWSWLGIDRNVGALLVLLCALAAVSVPFVRRRAA
jgi:hypothetical protein